MPQAKNLPTDRSFQWTYKKPQSHRGFFQKLLQSEDTYATTLLLVVADRYGLEGLEWHPRTIKMQLESDFGVELPKNTLDKVMAAIAIVTTDAFFKDLVRFIELSNILAGDDFNPTVFEPADSAEMAWAIAEAMVLFPAEGKDPFNEEIQGYVGSVLKEEGYVRPPKILSFATDADFSSQVEFDFQDDPEMFQAVYANQSAKAEEIDTLVMDNLRELFNQITSLPLKNGDTSQIKERIQKTLG